MYVPQASHLKCLPVSKHIKIKKSIKLQNRLTSNGYDSYFQLAPTDTIKDPPAVEKLNTFAWKFEQALEQVTKILSQKCKQVGKYSRESASKWKYIYIVFEYLLTLLNMVISKISQKGDILKTTSTSYTISAAYHTPLSLPSQTWYSITSSSKYDHAMSSERPVVTFYATKKRKFVNEYSTEPLSPY